MKVEPEVMRVLDASEKRGNCLTLPEQLDRKAYVAVNKVIELCGGKWHRKSKCHVFPLDAAEAVDRVLTAGEVVDVRKELQQFFTPPDLAAHLVRLAGVNRGDRCLEPSAGEGAIVSCLVAAGGDVEAYEVDYGTLARGQDRLRGSLRVRWHLGDFLAADAAPVFDRVVMNPPFARQQDSAHILRALQWLRPSGRLVAVASSSVAHRETALAGRLRDAVRRGCGTIAELPAGSFRSAGTEVNTVVVTINGCG